MVSIIFQRYVSFLLITSVDTYRLSNIRIYTIKLKKKIIMLLIF
jgi:hypothetical protein